jgi:hypothetical protein
MSVGPSTVRPSLELGRAVERMRRQNLSTLLVTALLEPEAVAPIGTTAILYIGARRDPRTSPISTYEVTDVLASIDEVS